MDLLKQDNWKALQPKLERLWGEDTYEVITDEFDFNNLAKLIGTIDKWVTEKMNIYKAINKKLLVENSEIHEKIQLANDRIIQYLKILKKKETTILAGLEEMAEDVEERDDLRDFEKATELLDDELSVYFDDYRQIWGYQVDFLKSDDLEKVQNAVNRLVDLGGFKSNVLEGKITIAEQLLDEVVREVVRYRKLNGRLLDAPPNSLIMGFKGKDILKLYNKNIPANSHGFRSVTTHLKFLLQINNALRKGGFDNEDRFELVEMALMEGKDYGDWEAYLKKASRFIKMLSPFANPASTIKLNDYPSRRDLVDEIDERSSYAVRVLAKLRNDFDDLL